MADGLLDNVRKLYEGKGLDGLWKWCMAPEGPHSKAKRFGAAAHFAGNRKAQASKPDERKAWQHRQEEYREQRDKFEKRYENRHDDADWPRSIVFSEYLYHYPGPHVHMASANRPALIQLARVGQEKFKLRIGEFPPFDTVDPVHVSGSWHYRKKLSNGNIIVLPTSSAELDKGGDGGLAMDANDADGGSDQEYAFYIEAGRRY